MEKKTLRRLTEEQYALFEKEGYLVVNDVFDPDDLQPVCHEIAGLVDVKARELHEKGELAETFPEADFKMRLAKITEHNVEAAKQIMRFLEGKGGGGHAGKEMFALITHPKMLAVIEDFIGPEIVGSSVYRIRPKVPMLNKGVVPWHQDSGYLMPHCDQELIITCWLPLVEATVENGCLMMLPRAHNHGIVRHYTGGNAGFLEIKEHDLPSGEPIHIPIPLGGAVFFTNRTPHCSTPNTTDHVRWSVDLRYQSAEVPNNLDQSPDSLDKDLPEIEIACYPPEADFLIKSDKNPEKVIRTHEQFHTIRQSYETGFKVGTVKLSRWS